MVDFCCSYIFRLENKHQPHLRMMVSNHYVKATLISVALVVNFPSSDTTRQGELTFIFKHTLLYTMKCVLWNEANIDVFASFVFLGIQIEDRLHQ